LNCCEDEGFDLFGLEFRAVGWHIDLEFELFDDGVEFRYVEMRDEVLDEDAVEVRRVL